MVVVYFESNSHAEEVARFDTEETYEKMRPHLVAEAKEANMIVTENVLSETLDSADKSSVILTKAMLELRSQMIDRGEKEDGVIISGIDVTLKKASNV